MEKFVIPQSAIILCLYVLIGFIVPKLIQIKFKAFDLDSQDDIQFAILSGLLWPISVILSIGALWLRWLKK